MIEIRIEMVVDLEPHQITYPDPNAEESYYMLTNFEDRNWGETITTRPQHIEGARRLGTNADGSSKMHGHHSSGAQPSDFPTDNDGVN